MNIKYKLRGITTKLIAHTKAPLYIHPIKKYVLLWQISGGKIFSKAIHDAFSVFYDGIYSKSIENDIIHAYAKYGAVPDEYFLFDFINCSPQRRSEFLTNRHKDHTMIRKVGMGKAWDMLEDKELFYEQFKEFFLRDICIVKSSEDKDNFLAFAKKHSKFIIKPNDGQCGRGIEIFDSSLLNMSQEEFFNSLVHKGKYICEELIIQDESISKWTSSSVNSIRLPSFINSKGFHILKPRIRFGINGSIVDNAGAGGLVAVIDEKTGRICTDAYDFKGSAYQAHPDTHKIFKGELIPQWNELLVLAEKVHRKIGWYPYVGWDFALTNKGWVLIEGNWGSFLGAEVADKEGIKKKFDEMFE